MSRPDLVVGLDPGVETGAVIYSRKERRLTYCKTLTFWAAYDLVTTMGAADVEVVIERPAAISGMYARHEGEQGARRREKMAQNVGSNKREAELLIERFGAMGYRVRAVPPVRARKWTADEFRKFTRWPKGESQHVRDAARLVIGL